MNKFYKWRENLCEDEKKKKSTEEGLEYFAPNRNNEDRYSSTI